MQIKIGHLSTSTQNSTVIESKSSLLLFDTVSTTFIPVKLLYHRKKGVVEVKVHCRTFYGFTVFTLWKERRDYKVLTYLEYRAASGVFRTIDPPPPLPLASVSSPHTKSGGVHTRRGVRGWGVNISEDARHWIGLLKYNPSTVEMIYL